MTYSKLNPNNGFEIRCGVTSITIPQGQYSKYESVTFSPAFTKSNIVVVATDNDWRTPYDAIPKISVLSKTQANFNLNIALPTNSSATTIAIGWIAIAW